jgi:hypothetical protein
MGGRLIIGFIAAMLAVLFVHQPIVMALGSGGFLPPAIKPYNMAALATAPAALTGLFKSLGFAGWPILLNSLFWGGLWGALFAAIHPRLPGGSMILKGLIFGLFMIVVSNWIVLPLIRGQPLFQGFVLARMWPGLVLQCCFGMALGLFYSLLRRNQS